MPHPTIHDLTERQRQMMSAADRKELGVLTMSDVQRAYDEASERQLQRLCEQALSQRGIEYLHMRTKQQAAAHPGWPDLTFVWAGEPMAVELKAPNGKVSDEQTKCHWRLLQNGWHVHVVRTFEEFERLLK